jgi:hypothetical protein
MHYIVIYHIAKEFEAFGSGLASKIGFAQSLSRETQGARQTKPHFLASTCGLARPLQKQFHSWVQVLTAPFGMTTICRLLVSDSSRQMPWHRRSEGSGTPRTFLTNKTFVPSSAHVFRYTNLGATLTNSILNPTGTT